MYLVQSGEVEILVGDVVVEVCGENEAIGFMSMIDDAQRSSTARVSQACELSIIDRRKFRFMVDEVPNFALYIRVRWRGGYVGWDRSCDAFESRDGTPQRRRK